VDCTLPESECHVEDFQLSTLTASRLSHEGRATRSRSFRAFAEATMELHEVTREK